MTLSAAECSFSVSYTSRNNIKQLVADAELSPYVVIYDLKFILEILSQI